MVKMLEWLGIACVAIVLFAAESSGQSAGASYRLMDSLQLGGEGGWDYLLVDTAAERLYVSRGMRVQVVDLEKLAVVGEIPETPGVHGIALAPPEGRGYTSNGRDSSVTVFDVRTLKTVAKIRIDGRNPDAIIYDAASDRVFTLNGGSDNATAIDARGNTVVGNVSLGGRPEFAVADGKGNVYVNLEDKSEIVGFDARSLALLKRWPIAPGEEPSGLAMDRVRGRLYSGCGNRLMAISDAGSGKLVTTVPIGAGVDAAAFDPGSGLAFSSNGEGTLTVIREEKPGTFLVVGNVPTRRGARTMALDEKTHNIYTVTARFGPPPPATADRPHPRPVIEPGSVTLYVLSRG